MLANSRGTLKIDLYRDGLRIVIDRGRLVEIEPWQAPVPEEESTAMGCPPLTFLQLLLGHRSLDELTAIHPDVWVPTGTATACRHAGGKDAVARGAVGVIKPNVDRIARLRDRIARGETVVLGGGAGTGERTASPVPRRPDARESALPVAAADLITASVFDRCRHACHESPSW